MTTGDSTCASRRERFRALRGCGRFVIPNLWDAGTARYLRRLGFPAPASTSPGFTSSRGPPAWRCRWRTC